MPWALSRAAATRNVDPSGMVVIVDPAAHRHVAPQRSSNHKATSRYIGIDRSSLFATSRT